MSQINIDKFKAAAIRAGRTFGQTAGGIIVAFWVAGFKTKGISIVDLYNSVVTNWDFAFGSGFFSALGALGWNFKKPITPETDIK